MARKIDLDIDKMLAMHTRGFGQAVIARELDVSQGTIGIALRKHGAKRMTTLQLHDRIAMLETEVAELRASRVNTVVRKRVSRV